MYSIHHLKLNREQTASWHSVLHTKTLIYIYIYYRQMENKNKQTHETHLNYLILQYHTTYEDQ